MIRALARPLLLAAALAGAAPALAQQAPSDAARQRQGVVMGLAALGALGFLLHERNEDRREARERRERLARTLPGECLVSWPVQGGRATLFDPDCLEGRFEAASALPIACARTVRSRGRFVSGFEPACLRDEGWVVPD